MGNVEKIEIGVYGMWGWKCPKDYTPDNGESFPPKGSKMVNMVGGNFETVREVPRSTIEWWKKDGATHVMIGKGDKVSVMDIDSALETWDRLEKDPTYHRVKNLEIDD